VVTRSQPHFIINTSLGFSDPGTFITEKGISQVLIEFRPERLFPVLGVEPGLRHKHQAFLTCFALRGSNLVGIPPRRWLWRSMNSMFCDNAAVIQNEVTPDQSPSDLPQDT